MIFRPKFSLISMASAAGVVLVGLIYLASLLPVGERNMGVLENIDGIPFPMSDSHYVVTEKLAHTDLYLKEPVLLKQVRLKLEFDPLNIERLSIGVRENSFWLSYPEEIIYDQRQGGEGKIVREVIIPLTDKIQANDRSVDIMFFARTAGDTADIDAGTSDQTLWHLYSLEASVGRSSPNWTQFKDYLKTVVKRERPL